MNLFSFGLLDSNKDFLLQVRCLVFILFYFFKFYLNFIYFFKFHFIFKLYNIVLVLPNIEMNLPQVYPWSPYPPSGSEGWHDVLICADLLV